MPEKCHFFTLPVLVRFHAVADILRPTAYWEAMQDVYRQCYAVLPVGGHLVLVVKGMIRQGRYVDTPTRTAALLEEVGFVVQHWHHAMLTAREAQLTFDGREQVVYLSPAAKSKRPA